MQLVDDECIGFAGQLGGHNLFMLQIVTIAIKMMPRDD
jgi:hypothetical protein